MSKKEGFAPVFRKGLFAAILWVCLLVEVILPSCAMCSTLYVPPQEVLLRTLDRGSRERAFEHVLGNPDAPIVIVAYGSLSCEGCADFHRDPVARLIEKYGKTSSICIILKDHATDGASLRASLLSWCVPEKSKELRKAFFETQQEWKQAEDPIPVLKKIAEAHGLSPGACKACLENKSLLADIVAFREKEKKLTRLTHVPLVFFIHRKRDGRGNVSVRVEPVSDADFDELDRLIRTSLRLS